MRPGRVLVVIRREYLSRVKTKAFVISTLSVPALILGMTVLPSLLMTRMGGEFTVAVVTSDQALYDAVAREVAERSGPSDTPGRLEVRLERVLPRPEVTRQRLALKQEVLSKKLAGVLILPEDILKGGAPEYLSTNVSNFRLLGLVERAVDRTVLHRRLGDAGVAEDRLAELTRRIDLHAVRIGADLSESREAAEVKSFVLSYVLTLTVFMTVMFYGYYVMRGVLEEKSSRIVEVVVANLTPFELMLGKILGIGAVGLTQYAIWVGLAMNLLLPVLPASVTEGSSALASPLLLLFFVLFFLIGYFQYASLYAALGAAFNTEEEAQQMQSLASVAMSLSVVLMVPVMSNPDATVSVVVSMLPFWAPVLFFVRMTVQFPPAWQILTCVVVQLVALLLEIRFAAAVYRVGILMYGKKPTLSEIWRWVRA